MTSEMTLGFPDSLGKFEKIPYLTANEFSNTT
jgi:hypothetical protein